MLTFKCHCLWKSLGSTRHPESNNSEIQCIQGILVRTVWAFTVGKTCSTACSWHAESPRKLVVLLKPFFNIDWTKLGCTVTVYTAQWLCQKIYICKHVEFGWQLGWSMLNVNCRQLIKFVLQCRRQKMWFGSLQTWLPELPGVAANGGSCWHPEPLAALVAAPLEAKKPAQAAKPDYRLRNSSSARDALME